MRPIDAMLDKVEWKAIGDGAKEGVLPIATHEGILKLGPLELRVFQLSDGRRVIEENDLFAFFGGVIDTDGDWRR